MTLNSIILIFLLFLPLISNAQLSQQATFSTIEQGIKTGECKAIIQQLKSQQTLFHRQPYFRTFTSIPSVGVGLIVMRMNTGVKLGFKVAVVNVNQTEMRISITALADTTIVQLKYTYIAIQKSGLYGYLQLFQFNQIVHNQSVSIDRTLTDVTYYSSHTYITQAFINDFNISLQNNDFSIKITASPKGVQAANLQVTFHISTNSTIYNASVYLFYIDQTNLQSQFVLFLDTGYIYGENSTTINFSFDFPLSLLNYYNLMRGADWLSFNMTNTSNVHVDFLSYPIDADYGYKYVACQGIHWRRRKCNTNSYFYLEKDYKCYQKCPQKYANITNGQYCESCHYSCQNCSSQNICTNCSLTKNRKINGTYCSCIQGYIDIGNQACQICHYSCQTCAISSNHCLTCTTTRGTPIQNKCDCPINTYDQMNGNSTCLSCHLSCQTCSLNSTNCLTCPALSNRIPTSNKCLCKSGYSEQNLICKPNSSLYCNIICQTCQTTSSTCTSCNSANNRTLNSNTCSCIAGYKSTSNSSSCSEICGDGVIYYLQCDDGNTQNGDGCSSTCQVQNGFDCENGTQPSKCIYDSEYLLELLSCLKRENDNIVDLSFRITPKPPVGTVGSISNINNTILSQSITQGVLSLQLSYNESIPLTQYGRLLLSTIPKTLQFQLVSQNGLSLTYYPPQTYTAFSAQNALVWVFITFLWIGIIIYCSLFKNSLRVLVEFCIAVGTVWIGIYGFESFGVLFLPLKQLRFIFLYNLDMEGSYGLFAKVNYGFLFLLIPVIVFLTRTLLIKCLPKLSMQQNTKRYLLLQLTYAFVCFYSIIIIYGLSTAIQGGQGTALGITSIMFGIIFLAMFAFGSFYFIKNNDFMPSIKAEMFLRKGAWFYTICIWIKIIALLTFCLVCFSNPGIQFIQFLIISISVAKVFTLLGIKPYENNLHFLVNQIMIILCYLCYLLRSLVSEAQWSGFAILILLYIGMLINYGMLAFAFKKSLNAKYEQSLSISSSRKSMAQQMVSPYQYPPHPPTNKIDLDFDPRLSPTGKKSYDMNNSTPKAEYDERRVETLKKEDDIVNPYASIHRRPANNLTVGGNNQSRLRLQNN